MGVSIEPERRHFRGGHGWGSRCPARRHQHVCRVETVRPYLGDPVRRLEIACIPQAIRIMYATSVAGLALCVVARWVVNS